MLLWRGKHDTVDSRRARRRATVPPASPSVSAGRPYGTGYSDQDIEALAAEDGAASVHDPSMWGPNAENVRVPNAINAAHAANAGLVGYDYRGRAAQLASELEHAQENARSAEQQALDDIEEDAEARQAFLELVRRVRGEGLELPHRHATRWYWLALVGFVLGDLTMISVAFQLMGLSDRLILGFIPFTSAVDIAASTSVFALLVLAHCAGGYLRGVLHDLERHRTTTDQAVRATLPKPSGVSLLLAGVLATVGAAELGGLSLVRAAFLSANHVRPEVWAFALIQTGVFVGALALSINHAHPYGRQLADVSRRASETTARMLSSCAAHARMVAFANELVHSLDAVLAQAGHHLAVSEADAIRQGQIYARRVQLSQPEPVSELLLAKSLPAPVAPAGTDAVAKLLAGVVERPKFKLLSTEQVNNRREQVREQLTEMRTRQGPGPSSEPVDKGASSEGRRGSRSKARKPPSSSVATNGGSKA